MTALHLAARFSSAPVVKTILEATKNKYLDCFSFVKGYPAVNDEDSEQSTPLHWAMRNKNKTALGEIVEYHARDEEEQFTLGHNHDDNVVKLLIKNGADVKAVDSNKSTPLHWALKHNASADVIRALVEAGGLVNVPDNDQCTPLIYAAMHNMFNVVMILLDGVDLKTIPNNEILKSFFRQWMDNIDLESTPLHFAAQHNQVNVVKFLIDSGADVRAVNREKWTPLHFAAMHNPNADVIKALVEGGAVVDARADYYNDYNCHIFKQFTPLHFAAWYNPSADVIRALVDKGADIEARDYRQQTPLHWAADRNQGMVKILIDEKANVNVLDSWQKSPLFFAANNKNRRAVIELCKAGANPQLGENPLDDNRVADEMKILIREKLSL